jgi:hypothetical protein
MPNLDRHRPDDPLPGRFCSVSDRSPNCGEVLPKGSHHARPIGDGASFSSLRRTLRGHHTPPKRPRAVLRPGQRTPLGFRHSRHGVVGDGLVFGHGIRVREELPALGAPLIIIRRGRARILSDSLHDNHRDRRAGSVGLVERERATAHVRRCAGMTEGGSHPISSSAALCGLMRGIPRASFWEELSDSFLGPPGVEVWTIRVSSRSESGRARAPSLGARRGAARAFRGRSTVVSKASSGTGGAEGASRPLVVSDSTSNAGSWPGSFSCIFDGTSPKDSS